MAAARKKVRKSPPPPPAERWQPIDDAAPGATPPAVTFRLPPELAELLSLADEVRGVIAHGQAFVAQITAGAKARGRRRR